MIQRARLRLGPGDHGQRMSYDEYLAGDYQPGYKYELIDGELYVSPEANRAHDWVEWGLLRAFGKNDFQLPSSCVQLQ